MKRFVLFVVAALCSGAGCMGQYLNPMDSLLCGIGEKDQELRLKLIRNNIINEEYSGYGVVMDEKISPEELDKIAKENSLVLIKEN